MTEPVQITARHMSVRNMSPPIPFSLRDWSVTITCFPRTVHIKRARNACGKLHRSEKNLQSQKAFDRIGANYAGSTPGGGLRCRDSCLNRERRFFLLGGGGVRTRRARHSRVA